jgi:hypothetical protein
MSSYHAEFIEAEAEVEQELVWEVVAAAKKRGASTHDELYRKLLTADDPEAAGELVALRALATWMADEQGKR